MAHTKTPRNAILASIHIIKNEIGLDDDAYRDVIAVNFNGRRSASALNDAERNRLLLHLKSLHKRKGLNTEGVRHEAMIKKCEALWIELRKDGKVHNGSIAALESFVRNKTGAAGLRMANGQQLYQAIEILKSWLDRKHPKNEGKNENQ